MRDTGGADEDEQPLEAAFERPLEVVLYLVGLALVFLLPVALTALGLPKRRSLYAEMPTAGGSFSFLEHEVFDTQGDIDALFVGTSVLWAAIDTPLVRDALRGQVGHEPVVLTFGYNQRGVDELTYLLLHDLLDRRRVHQLFISLPRPRDTGSMHAWALRFMGAGTAWTMTEGMPMHERLEYLEAATLGAPRQLLESVRTPKRAPMEHADVLGADSIHHMLDGSPFESFEPPPPTFDAGELHVADETARYPEGEKPLTTMQLFFLKKIFSEAEAHHVPVTVIYMPMWAEVDFEKVPFQVDWQAALGRRIDVIGAPPAALFRGLSKADVRRLYADIGHLNANGARLFTSAILPALVETVRHAESRNH